MSAVTVDEVLQSIEIFTPAEIASVKKGAIVQRTLESTNVRELAAGFALTIKISREDLRDIFLTSKGKEETDHTIQAMGLLDPEHPDFSAVKLTPGTREAIKAYVTAKAGSDMNLSKEEIAWFHALGKNASQEQVERVLHNMLTERLQAYHQKGLEGIAPYQRSRETYEPGQELKLKSEKAPVLQKLCPSFYQYILDYPNSKPADAEESYSWINFTIDDKPCIALVHKVGMWSDKIGAFVYYQRHFYVSRGHNSVQGVGVAYPMPNNDKDEMVAVYGSRTSTDQVTGFGGAAKRGIGSRIMCGRLADNLAKFRTKAEKIP